jgi:hypothetical protein
MPSMPRVTIWTHSSAWRADPSRCLAAALDIARSHGLPHADPHLFSTGTNLVVALDAGLVLKLFPPMLRDQFTRSEPHCCSFAAGSASRSRRSWSKASATNGHIWS